jgi:hypothetical protein
MLVPPRRTEAEIGSREDTVPLKGQHVEHTDFTGGPLCEARLYMLGTVHKEIMSGSARDAPQTTTTTTRFSEAFSFEHCTNAAQPAGDMISTLNYNA